MSGADSPIGKSAVVAAPALTPIHRLHGLDWLRAGATILVVALHAGIAYLVAPFPGLCWSTCDPVGSLAVDGITWWIDGFIMPLFFLLGGFVAWGLMQRRGPRRFLAHRTRRLLGPFLLGCVLILPLDLYIWLLGWAADGRISLRKLQSLKVEGRMADGLWGTSHLWFLQYLWLFCVGAAVVSWISNWRRQDYLVREEDDATGDSLDFLRRPQPFSVLRTRYADDLIVGLLGVSVFALWWEPQLVIGFRHSWWPLPANLLFYAPWFTIGWIMASRQPRRRVSHGEWRLVASLVVFPVLWLLIEWHVASQLVGPMRVVLASVFVLHAWLAVTGWLGVCLRWLDHKPPAAVKYVAAASFWVYLFHHPMVGLTHVSLRTASMPPFAKYTLTLAISLTLCLLTYEVLVRRTWIGLVLNGRRDIARRSIQTQQEPTMPLPLPAEHPRRKAA